MILLRSIKLSVLVLSFACLGISSTGFAGTCSTTKCSTSECTDKCNCPDGCCTADCKCSKKCSTRCGSSVEQLLMDAGSLSLSVLTYYLYHSRLRPHLIARADDEGNDSRHHIVEELGKAVATIWFVDQAKDFVRSLRCYLLGKVTPVIQEAQTMVTPQ